MGNDQLALAGFSVSISRSLRVLLYTFIKFAQRLKVLANAAIFAQVVKIFPSACILSNFVEVIKRYEVEAPFSYKKARCEGLVVLFIFLILAMIALIHLSHPSCAIGSICSCSTT